jgi:hypothetical protein
LHFSTSSILKKIKLIKIILEKKHKKTMWKKHYSNPQYFKKIEKLCGKTP